MICRSFRVLLIGIVAAICLAVTSTSNAGPIHWVTVGDPGNTADSAPAGYGAVATSFQIMKYEFTNQQYTDFLNSVDAAGTNPYSVYNTNMGSNARGGIDFTDGAATGSKYGVKTNMADKPVNYVSWFDAARVSNWLMNGATSSSSTEIGAYSLIGGQISGTVPSVNPNATYYVPLEDQWYKAAYYKGGGTNSGYWNFATQSDVAPEAVTADAAGDASAENTGNFANYKNAASWNGLSGNVTTVGTNGGPSAYGVFDQGGSVYEWNDLDGTSSLLRGARSGSFNSGDYTRVWSEWREAVDPTFEDFHVGFRLASTVSSGVPEIDPSSFGSVLALVFGAFGLLERRRSR